MLIPRLVFGQHVNDLQNVIDRQTPVVININELLGSRQTSRVLQSSAILRDTLARQTIDQQNSIERADIAIEIHITSFHKVVADITRKQVSTLQLLNLQPGTMSRAIWKTRGFHSSTSCQKRKTKATKHGRGYPRSDHHVCPNCQKTALES